MPTPDPPRSAWREPMLWLVIGIPAATILAGLTTLAIAAGGPEMARASGVRVTAQIQVEQPAPAEAPPPR